MLQTSKDTASSKKDLQEVRKKVLKAVLVPAILELLSEITVSSVPTSSPFSRNDTASNLAREQSTPYYIPWKKRNKSRKYSNDIGVFTY